MRVLIHTRVSTDAQERDGTSLDTQERACREFARAAGWRVLDCIRDAASGFSLDRSGVARLREQLRHGGVDVVLAYAVDRLSRNQNHIGVLFDEVQSAGARFEFVTERFEDTATGRFILAARAFIAEVEREKIVERTLRGKAERARSGKLPQATGRGIYGYVYNRQTGRREVEPAQAVVVNRIFQRYAETRSFSAVASELNEQGLPAFGGGRWYPLTVRTVLTNETYTGRTIFRRTRRVASRSSPTGKRTTRIVERPSEEWIEIEDATPPIIDRALWDRVQRIISDPERIRRRPDGRFYALSTRARCAHCGSAMVGQTLTVKGSPYRYYRCRHVYDKNTGRNCVARYVRGPELEAAVWREIERVLADPAIVLYELTRQHDAAAASDDMVRMEQEITALRAREKRLVKLYSFGEVDEDAIREEAAGLRRQRVLLEERLRERQAPALRGVTIDPKALTRICAAIVTWWRNAAEQDRVQALEALQVTVEATTHAASITGVLPSDLPAFIADNALCRCSCSGE